MNKLKLITRLFMANNLTNLKNIVKNLVVLTILLSILLSFSILLKVEQHSHTLAYAETEFDYIVQGFSGNQIGEILGQDFVDSVFPVRILSGKILTENREVTVHNLYAADSFEDMDISYFAQRLIINKSDRLLKKGENPIVIDREIAKSVRAGLGDVISVPVGPEQRPVLFTVAAICEPLKPTSALILWRGEQREIFLDSFGEDPQYSLMFVKVNNKAAAEEYFRQQYKPEWYIELFDPLCEEELRRYIVTSVVSRETRLEEELYEFRFAPPIIRLISIMGFSILLIVIYREANKNLALIEKDFYILNALGLPKYYLIIYNMLQAGLMQVPVILFASFVTRHLIYDTIFQHYIPSYLMLQFVAIAFSLQILAVLICGIILWRVMKKKDTALLLAKE